MFPKAGLRHRNAETSPSNRLSPAQISLPCNPPRNKASGTSSNNGFVGLSSHGFVGIGLVRRTSHSVLYLSINEAFIAAPLSAPDTQPAFPRQSALEVRPTLLAARPGLRQNTEILAYPPCSRPAVASESPNRRPRYTEDMENAEIKIVSNEAGEPTAVIVPIELWREIESEQETTYLLKSEPMKQRLLAAKQRQEGFSLEAVAEKLRI